jgi:hypothetical protein
LFLPLALEGASSPESSFSAAFYYTPFYPDSLFSSYRASLASNSASSFSFLALALALLIDDFEGPAPPSSPLLSSTGSYSATSFFSSFSTIFLWVLIYLLYFNLN